jgi:hypothetical protein
LEGPIRRTEPDRATYDHEEDGQPCDLYLEHLENYELTLLRGVFMDRMRALEPGWVDVFGKKPSAKEILIMQYGVAIMFSRCGSYESGLKMSPLETTMRACVKGLIRLRNC